jgi:hypothetical protein
MTGQNVENLLACLIQILPLQVRKPSPRIRIDIGGQLRCGSLSKCRDRTCGHEQNCGAVEPGSM